MPDLRPVLALEASGLAPSGADRVRLLEAVGRAGSISAAARLLGLSYKHVWDGIAALNTLAGEPLVAGRKGGAKGGGAALTPAGARFVEAFRRLEGETAERLRHIAAEGEGALSLRPLAAGVLRTSARNTLPGTVTRIEDGPVACTVTLALTAGASLQAVITHRSLVELGLFPGRRAIALIKAPFVRLGPAGGGLSGPILRIDRDGDVAEVTLNLGEGTHLTAICPRTAVEGWSTGLPRGAEIDPNHIILAVD